MAHNLALGGSMQFSCWGCRADKSHIRADERGGARGICGRRAAHGFKRGSPRFTKTARRFPSQRDPERREPLCLLAPYSIPRPNLFDFGKPFGGRRPASARLPRQSASSLIVALNSRPAESFQVRPSLASNVAISDNPPSLYFCRRTPRPRAISGT